MPFEPRVQNPHTVTSAAFSQTKQGVTKLDSRVQRVVLDGSCYSLIASAVDTGRPSIVAINVVSVPHPLFYSTDNFPCDPLSHLLSSYSILY